MWSESCAIYWGEVGNGWMVGRKWAWLPRLSWWLQRARCLEAGGGGGGGVGGGGGGARGGGGGGGGGGAWDWGGGGGDGGGGGGGGGGWGGGGLVGGGGGGVSGIGEVVCMNLLGVRGHGWLLTWT